ncbi:MAG TPA: tRNA lysidine(34) synthetase TilS [Methyloceanibacter sp.]|nr:tRNA lysidine(34) synthetase TilS [Methyloceanibacter sp.]
MSAAYLSEAEADKLLAPFATYKRQALAVSGGPDSLALLHLAAPWAQANGIALTVLTVDHGLRAGSAIEAERVAIGAARLGLPHATLRWTPPADLTSGLQASARQARYDLLAGYCHQQGIKALLTAHHRDDQAETFLMRLARGSGLDGLAAMPVRGAWAGIAVLRPLLDVPKARLVATLEERGVSFSTDPSNSDPRFERTRLREESETLARIGLTAEAIARSVGRLRRAREALEHATEAFLSAHGEAHEAGYCVLDRGALATAPEEIALRALARVLDAVTGREEAASLAKIEALLEPLLAESDKARTIGGCRLQPSGDQLFIVREVRADSALPIVAVAPGQCAVWDCRFAVTLDPAAVSGIAVRALGDAAFLAARRNDPWLAGLPRLAGRTLPALWQGEKLLGLPAFGAHATIALGAKATFVHALPR